MKDFDTGRLITESKTWDERVFNHMTWCSVTVKVVRITNSLYDPDFMRMFS